MSDESDGDIHQMIDWDSALKDPNSTIPSFKQPALQIMVEIMRHPDKSAHWTDTTEEPVIYSKPMTLSQFYLLVYKSYVHYVVHGHHKLPICVAGAVRNPWNIIFLWFPKHWICHGCLVILFVELEYVQSLMRAFALMTGNMQIYADQTLHLEGGFNALVRHLQFEDVLKACTKVTSQVIVKSSGMDLGLLKSAITSLKSGNFSFVYHLANESSKYH